MPMLARTRKWLDGHPWAWTLIAALATAAVLWALSCAFPDLALAAPEDEGGEEEDGGILGALGDVFDTITNPGEAIMTAVSRLLVGMFVNAYNWSMGLMDYSVTGSVAQPFNELFGLGGSQVFDFVRSINDSLVTSVGYTFLAIVLLVRLAQLGQRMDGNGTLPAVKEVFLLIVWYAVLLFLINNSFEICQAVYAIATALVNIVSSAAPTIDEGAVYELTEETINGAGLTLAAVAIMFILMLFFLLLSLVTQVVVQFVVWGRALQIYALAAFSPVALPFLGNDETRPWAMGFIKTFISVCVAGAIMAFILYVFPFIYQLVLMDTGEGTFSDVMNLIMWMIRFIAFYLVEMYALIKSGSWARDLLGG